MDVRIVVGAAAVARTHRMPSDDIAVSSASASVMSPAEAVQREAKGCPVSLVGDFRFADLVDAFAERNHVEGRQPNANPKSRRLGADAGDDLYAGSECAPRATRILPGRVMPLSSSWPR